jgi:hypothetical protein
MHPKAVPWKIEIVLCAVMGLHATGLSTVFYYMTILFMWALLRNKYFLL